MKEIMQTYGAMIVAVVVGIALLSGFGALKMCIRDSFEVFSESDALVFRLNVTAIVLSVIHILLL